MKQVLLAIGAVVGAIVLSTPSTNAASQRCSHGPHPARMTAKALRMHNQPIGVGECYLLKGPIWDPFRAARPGYGMSMVVYGHDVTPVPGYNGHGPFYRLHLLKPGNLVTITWKGVKYTYRVATKPFAKRQCASKRVNESAGHLDGTVPCVTFDKPVKQWGTEALYLRCCWPRYTREKYLYIRAMLVKTTSVS